MKFYPLGDPLTQEEKKKLGVEKHVVLRTFNWSSSNVKAIRTTEYRCPKKGEWYLSGSVIAAYRAPNDLGMKFHIARLVRVEEKTVTTIVQQM